MKTGGDANTLWTHALSTVGEAARLARRGDTPLGEWEDIFRALVPVWAMPTEATKVCCRLFEAVLTPAEAIAVCIAYRFCEARPLTADHAQRISEVVLAQLPFGDGHALRLDAAIAAVPPRLFASQAGRVKIGWSEPDAVIPACAIMAGPFAAISARFDGATLADGAPKTVITADLDRGHYIGLKGIEIGNLVKDGDHPV